MVYQVVLVSDFIVVSQKVWTLSWTVAVFHYLKVGIKKYLVSFCGEAVGGWQWWRTQVETIDIPVWYTRIVVTFAVSIVISSLETCLCTRSGNSHKIMTKCMGVMTSTCRASVLHLSGWVTSKDLFSDHWDRNLESPSEKLTSPNLENQFFCQSIIF